MGKKVQSYTAEFRAEAIKLVLSQGFSLQGLHSGFQCPRGHS
jgi:transposase-like protein